MKTELAEHRVRLNVAAFYYRYKNIQVQEIVSGATISLNAAASEMKESMSIVRFGHRCPHCAGWLRANERSLH
jgi:hypothetical protein